MPDKTRFFSKTDRFVYSMREYGEQIGNTTFIDRHTIIPGEGDDVDANGRKMIAECYGAVITEHAPRITIEFLPRYDFVQRRNRAEYADSHAK